MFIACDESGIDGKKSKFVIGSCWLPKNQLSSYEKAVTELRLDQKVWGEIKWDKNLTADYLPLYKEFLNLTFSVFNARYKCMVVDKKMVDYKKYHASDKILAFFKFYRLFLSNKIKEEISRDKNLSFHVVVDQCSDNKNSYFKSFDEYLKNSCRGAIENLSPCTSHICSLVQASDLVTGAVAAAHNELREGENKQKLSNYIEYLVDHKLNQCTSPLSNKINIWVWRPPVKPV